MGFVIRDLWIGWFQKALGVVDRCYSWVLMTEDYVPPIEPGPLDIGGWSDIQVSDVVLVNSLSRIWSTSDVWRDRLIIGSKHPSANNYTTVFLAFKMTQPDMNAPTTFWCSDRAVLPGVVFQELSENAKNNRQIVNIWQCLWRPLLVTPGSPISGLLAFLNNFWRGYANNAVQAGHWNVGYCKMTPL